MKIVKLLLRNRLPELLVVALSLSLYIGSLWVVAQAR